MTDIIDHLRSLKGCCVQPTFRHALDATGGKEVIEAAIAEIERLRERLGPRGLEVVEINGVGHYVSEKVKTEIERLRTTPSLIGEDRK